jgi:molybdopterin-guanine dinucleotide biosynthesis protein A
MNHAPRLDSVAGVILAGGEARRLGGAIKANIAVGGVRLLERVASALESAAPLLVAHGRINPVRLDLSAGLAPLADPAGELRGPAAGLAAAAAWAQTQQQPPALIVSAAVDTPFLPRDFVTRLHAAMTPGIDAAVAGYGAEVYWTNALWRRAALERLLDPEAARVAASGGIKAFARTLRMAVVRWPETAGGDPFANVNTPADLSRLARRNT